MTDVVRYGSLRRALSWGGDLRALPATALADPRSVTFGRTHDNLAEIRLQRQDALDPWNHPADAWLAAAHGQDGTPLVLAGDAAAVRCLSAGAQFRRILATRGREGRNMSVTILRPIERSTVLLLQRGRGIRRDPQGRRTLHRLPLHTVPAHADPALTLSALLPARP